MGLASTLTVIFIVLKLTHLINWSWWFVISPLLIWFVLYIIIIFIATCKKSNNRFK